jgi:acyl-CoA thioester hydrolase
MGVAHHAAYVPWLEAARTEILRDAGVSYAQLESAGVFLVVTKIEVRYRRAGRYDDLLEVRARVVGGGRVKIEHEYEVRVAERIGADVARMRETGEDLLAGATTTLACVDERGRVRALPDWLAGG